MWQNLRNSKKLIYNNLQLFKRQRGHDKTILYQTDCIALKASESHSYWVVSSKKAVSLVILSKYAVKMRKKLLVA